MEDWAGDNLHAQWTIRAPDAFGENFLLFKSVAPLVELAVALGLCDAPVLLFLGSLFFLSYLRQRIYAAALSAAVVRSTSFALVRSGECEGNPLSCPHGALEGRCRALSPKYGCLDGAPLI